MFYVHYYIYIYWLTVTNTLHMFQCITPYRIFQLIFKCKMNTRHYQGKSKKCSRYKFICLSPISYIGYEIVDCKALRRLFGITNGIRSSLKNVKNEILNISFSKPHKPSNQQCNVVNLSFSCGNGLLLNFTRHIFATTYFCRTYLVPLSNK